MRARSHGGRNRQRGLALITAILVVAIVATVTTYLALGQQLWLRQTQNLADRAEADSLQQAALAWAAILLGRDAGANKIDHLGESWARPLPPLPAESGTITMTIRDAQGLFNLNNLVRNGSPSTADIAVFRRLLNAQGIDPAITEALLDWMDPDSDARPGGAEDVDYLALARPYRAANQPLTSVDELRLVKGFTAQVVDKLRPYVTVLPQPTAINVNTASDRVLAALFSDLSPSTLQPVVESRVARPFADTAQFLQRLPPGHSPPQAAYGVSSAYFLVNIETRVGPLQRRSEALVYRQEGRPATVLWQRPNPIQPASTTNEET